MKNQIPPRQITVPEMAPHIHSFAYGENRVEKITDWLKKWVEKSLKEGKISPFDFLPSKRDLASHIGVSLGTMQNAFRNLEDIGIVESKQRIGTYISDKQSEGEEKLTSKREVAVECIKKHISENKYKIGDKLASLRQISDITGISISTVRNAINALLIQGILEKKANSFFVKKIKFNTQKVENMTLVNKTAKQIQKYIVEKELKEGDKLPSNPDLAKQYRVSIKTIHDAIKILTKEGKLMTKRGKYGTIVATSDLTKTPYFYEEVEVKIKSFIVQNCEIGSKLPSIKVLSDMYSVSSKTVKKALDNISDDGYVAFSRGRYGGTFVTDIPQGTSEAYTWLALNPYYIKTDEN